MLQAETKGQRQQGGAAALLGLLEASNVPDANTAYQALAAKGLMSIQAVVDQPQVTDEALKKLGLKKGMRVTIRTAAERILLNALGDGSGGGAGGDELWRVGEQFD